jgi:hypothetical protein
MNIYTLINTPLSNSELDSTPVKTTSNIDYAIKHLAQSSCNSVLVGKNGEPKTQAVTYNHGDLESLIDTKQLTTNVGASMQAIHWQTEEPHADNNTTMNDYLDNANILDITLVDGTYAEGVNCKGEKYEIHASGDGDSFNHKVEFKLISELG